MSLEIVLFRHAERNKFIEDEPQLSPYGLKQAHYLSEQITKFKLPKPTSLWVSPRLRAQQTFSALSIKYEVGLTIKSDLDERKSHETIIQFRQRISHFLKTLLTQQGIIYICTHLDWIEESISLLDCDTDLLNQPGTHWVTAQFLNLRYDFENEFWHKLNIGQVSL